MEPQEIYSELDKNLMIQNKRGRVVLHLGLLVSLYFDNSHCKELRQAVAESAEEYLAMCGEHLRWMTHPETYHLYDINKEKLPSPQERVENLSEEEFFQFDCYGGMKKNDASPFQLEIYCKNQWKSEVKKGIGYFQACLPFLWFADHEGDFASLVFKWIQKIKPIHGYGGLGIICPTRLAIHQGFEPEVYGLAKRFLGLEVDDPSSHTLYCREAYEIRESEKIPLVKPNQQLETEFCAMGGLREDPREQAL